MLLGLLSSILCPTATGQEWVLPPEPSTATGDVFVPGPTGATILIDGKPTGLSAPTTVERLPIGPHVIGLRRGCDGIDIPVDVRRGAIERAEGLLGRGPASIAIGVNVDGASVWLDGMSLGQSPVSIMHTSCGIHIVEAEAVGYGRAVAEVRLGYAESLPFGLTLAAIEVGNIAVNLRPFEAEVWIDGQLRGTGPLTVNALQVGLHEVTAHAKGFEPGRAPVTVRGGETVRVELSLVQAKSFAERSGFNQLDWARLAVGSGLGAIAVGSGILAATQFLAVDVAYAEYLTLDYTDDPEAFYVAKVEQPTVAAYGLTGLAAIGLGSSTYLLATLKPRVHAAAVVPSVSPLAIGVMGTF